MVKFIYNRGFKIGLSLVILPILTDVLWHGGREWNLVSIGNWGVLCQIVGVVLMLISPRYPKPNRQLWD